MSELVASGTHDLVGLARPAVLVPDLAARVLAGERPKLDEPRFAPIPGVVSALALRWYTQRIHALAGA